MKHRTDSDVFTNRDDNSMNIFEFRRLEISHVYVELFSKRHYPPQMYWANFKDYQTNVFCKKKLSEGIKCFEFELVMHLFSLQINILHVFKIVSLRNSFSFVSL